MENPYYMQALKERHSTDMHGQSIQTAIVRPSEDDKLSSANKTLASHLQAQQDYTDMMFADGSVQANRG